MANPRLDGSKRRRSYVGLPPSLALPYNLLVLLRVMEIRMNTVEAAGGETFDVAYLMVSGTTTAARAPELLHGLIQLGFTTVIAVPTPNASRVIAPRDLADIKGVQVVESYFDLAIRPRPPRGVVLFAPCSFNSLNKLAHGVADNLALSIVAEAIGRGTPVVLGPSLNQPLLDHPAAQSSLRTLLNWNVMIVRPVDLGEGPRLAPSEDLIDAVRSFARRIQDRAG
jgi:phosphopantothenoylcysteine synthetase/decarboxylase